MARCKSCSNDSPGYGLEERLNSIFRLAHLWDCVLLMDEADVFLSARDNVGPRNTTVSVFLRRLEYYNGLLFLTTNRIGKLDPAITSRIHLILHYRRLGPTEIQNIFLINIRRLQAIEQQQHKITGEPPLFIMEREILKFAADHCNKHPKSKGAWNGRQIRNAFIVAASLSRHEANQPELEGSGFQPQLRYSHFQEVEKLSKEFDRFRAHVLGGDDSRKARLNEERDDDWDEQDDDDDKDDRASVISNRFKLAERLYMDPEDVSTPSFQGVGRAGGGGGQHAGVGHGMTAIPQQTMPDSVCPWPDQNRLYDQTWAPPREQPAIMNQESTGVLLEPFQNQHQGQFLPSQEARVPYVSLRPAPDQHGFYSSSSQTQHTGLHQVVGATQFFTSPAAVQQPDLLSAGGRTETTAQKPGQPMPQSATQCLPNRVASEALPARSNGS